MNTAHRLTGGRLPAWLIASSHGRASGSRTGALDLMVSKSITDAIPTSDGKKFLDPWFRQPGNVAADSFDFRLSELAPSGTIRMTAIADEVTRRANLISSGKALPEERNQPGAFALLNGTRALSDQLTKSSTDFLNMQAVDTATAIGAVSTVVSYYFGTAMGNWYASYSKEFFDSVISAIETHFGPEAGHPKEIIADLRTAGNCFGDITKQLLVPPFNAFNWGSPDNEYWQDVEQQRNIVCHYSDKWQKIDPASAKPVQEWFAILAKVSKTNEIARGFIFSTWNDEGLASDSQVYLAALPLAIFYGFDVIDFAAALWEKSKGWSSRLMLITKEGEADTPNNAGVVQWCVLCQDALELAAKWKAEGKTGWMGILAVLDGKPPADTNAHRRSVEIYAIGVAFAGAIGYFLTPWASPLPLIGSWLAARRK
jgi:hypothetical protein